MLAVGVIALLAALYLGHFLGDYPLQGDFLARAKNHKSPIPGIPWEQALTAHAFIQGGLTGLVVFAFSNSLPMTLTFGFAEAAAHWGIDWLKCEGALSFRQDQLLHIACKFAWTALFCLWVMS